MTLFSPSSLSQWPLSFTAKNIMQVMTFDGNDEKRKKKVLNDAKICSRTTKARSFNSIYLNLLLQSAMSK